MKLNDLIKVKHGYAFKGEHFADEPTPHVLVTPGNFAIGGGFQDSKLKFYRGPVPEGPSSFRVERNSQNHSSSSSPVGMWAGCI